MTIKIQQRPEIESVPVVPDPADEEDEEEVSPEDEGEDDFEELDDS